MSFKILKFNCCGLDVHKTWIYSCIGITDSNNRTEYKQARFSSFTKGLNKLCDWLAKYNCKDVCMESTGKYWIPVFNLLEQHDIWVTLFHPPKYTKPMKGNKTDRKDTKYMCGMVKPSFIPPADISALRDLVRYRFKLTWVIFGGQTPTDALLHGYILSEQKVIYQREVWDMKGMKRHTKNSSHFWLELFF